MAESTSETERKVVSILKVLSESSEPLGSAAIAQELKRYGIVLSERAVRYHLRITDERGYTQGMGRDGRMLTTHGLEELKMALAPEQVGYILDKLELLAFQTTFDPRKKTGKVPINTSLIAQEQFRDALDVMSGTFRAGLCVSDLVATAKEGEKLGNVIIPSGKVGLATVCSVVINGVLLKAGIPVDCRFGGVLEIRDATPRRFTAVIHYDGTSLDPSEQYIRAKMTSVRETARAGNGKILANFRVMPAPSRAVAAEKIAQLQDVGIYGVSALGNTSERICQVGVGLNQVGMVLLGGLNPVASAYESGIEIENIAESGLVDFEELVSFWQL